MNRYSKPRHERLWATYTPWTFKMMRSINRIRQAEPQFSRDKRPHYETLRWRCQIVLEYLQHRAEGRGQRDWGLYGHEARVEG